MDQLVTLNRRDLLKSTTGLLTGWVVAGSPLALIAPGRAWAVDLTALTSSEGATLMSMARTIARMTSWTTRRMRWSSKRSTAMPERMRAHAR